MNPTSKDSSRSSFSEADSDYERKLVAYDYELPPERIAQNPVVPRDSARLLVVETATRHSHHIFRDLPDLLQPGDLLVFNNTKVIPARLKGRKSTGAPVEVLLLEEREENFWLALVKPGKRLKVGSEILFASPKSEFSPGEQEFVLRAKVVAVDKATGGRFIKFYVPEGTLVVQLLEKFGQIPLPPYIKASEALPEQYQTVYAEKPGAVAAPTAGLHFTEELLARLRSRGINLAFVTLHIGVGTFRAVEVEDVTTHKMHEEWVEVPATVVEQIRQTKERGGRVIAVGTTVVRSLEAAATNGQLMPFCGKTDLFIYPGYQWRVVEGLITNFHLPRSSLLMLVSAFVGRKRLLALYQEAIVLAYRFYSFGDAMLILPAARI
ncbi:MAG: tRNA preQ1(34) S-adenosylmethionine ribosyltransferase-isomerase QueA [Oscillatoriaceae bacterium SKW80]|nr:tRNA preQ1(34) S-adenosylmethionine ribosyltransferase-isomerase QueA [Oscillatoriaceae bacterium SKYG93]MCX8120958.1 tRNA preQ1(34) S-adenosylmethionine ribosyltransferase-isomerase QueA [Oscillatoriaceae bacterium SKW80]MDW8452231.1 tRNA preQ1(34) S-adenosylmethionine ribosyltransferase-isomerase QueA [Oscillatoriaceae cyanobacterium SKYGB_i_bin93]